MAEYQACISSLEATFNMHVKDLEVYREFILILVNLQESGK